jgi:hypothetical protein
LAAGRGSGRHRDFAGSVPCCQRQNVSQGCELPDALDLDQRLCLWILRLRESLDRAVVLLNLHCHLRDANLTLRMRNLVSLLSSEWKDLEQQIIAMNADVEQIVAYATARDQLILAGVLLTMLLLGLLAPLFLHAVLSQSTQRSYCENRRNLSSRLAR